MRGKSVLVVFVVLAATYGWHRWAETTRVDTAALPAMISEVRLNHDSGNITIAAGDGPPTVRRIAEFHGGALGPSHRVEGDTLVLGGCGYFCTAHYEVSVPRGVRVSGHLTSGNLAITQPSAVDVRVTSGDVRVTGGAQDVQVGATSGHVVVELAQQHNVRVQVTSGDIELAVPDGTYRVSTKTTGGTAEVAVAHDPRATTTLDLRTTNGDIKINR